MRMKLICHKLKRVGLRFWATRLLCWRHVRSFNISIVSSNLKVRKWFFSSDTMVRNRKVKTFIFETRHTNNTHNRVNFIEIHSKQCHFTLIERVIIRQQNDRKKISLVARGRRTTKAVAKHIYTILRYHFYLRTPMTTIIVSSTEMYIWHHHLLFVSSLIAIYSKWSVRSLILWCVCVCVCGCWICMHCTVHHFIRA